MSEYICHDYISKDGMRQQEWREEITRCRDCREYNPELYNHISCELLGRYVEPTGFCKWGERKDNGNS